jgi:hypothetical protein
MEPFFFPNTYTQEDIEYDIDILLEKANRYQQSITFMRILLEDAVEGDQIIQDIHKTIDEYNIRIDKINNEIDNLNAELFEQNDLQDPIQYDNINCITNNKNMSIVNKEQVAVDKNEKTITIKIILP